MSMCRFLLTAGVVIFLALGDGFGAEGSLEDEKTEGSGSTQKKEPTGAMEELEAAIEAAGGAKSDKKLQAAGVSTWSFDPASEASREDERARKRLKDARSLIAIVSSQRKVTIDKLVCILENAQESEATLAAAAEALGHLRAPEAAPLLLKRIDLKIPPPLDTGGSELDFRSYSLHPAVRALMSIGMPAVEAILADMRQEQTEKRLRMYGAIIEEVLGPDLGRMYVKRNMPRGMEAAVRLKRTKELQNYIQ